jgi:hypothetical protein
VELESTSDFEKTILDHAVKIGSLAKIEKVATSQLEQIIASLENSPDRRNSLLICAAFAMRQAKRSEGFIKTGKAIVEAIKEIYSKNGGKEDVRKLLGLAKWVKESLENENIPAQGFKNFDEYLNFFKHSNKR